MDDFNDWYAAGFALLDLSLLGEKIDMENNVFEDALAAMSSWQKSSLAVWFCLYYLYIVIMIILLINLLIAMMSATFESVHADATLQSRLAFATAMIKLEGHAMSMGIPTRVGEATPSGTYVYKFRTEDKKTNDDDDASDDGPRPMLSPTRSQPPELP